MPPPPPSSNMDDTSVHSSPPPRTTTDERPSLEPTSFVSSDSSIDTISSTMSNLTTTSSRSSDSSVSENPYARLVVVEQSVAREPGPWDFGVATARSSLSFTREVSGSQSTPGSRSGSFASVGAEPPLFASTSPRSSFEGPSRHSSLPAIDTDLVSPTASSQHRFPASYNPVGLMPPPPLLPHGSSSDSTQTLTAESMNSALISTPDSSPSISPTTTFYPSRSTTLPPPSWTSSAPTSSSTMSRSHSSSASATAHARFPSGSSTAASFATGPRPGSSETFSSNSTGSSRPWVRDSDASSVCSGGSSCWSSSGGGFCEEDGEVYKVADGLDFLDSRPEPADAKLSINRDDPKQVVLKVTLRGFLLDNITVAMRRGHKVHIVADSFGEDGGHFEKLISLGPDVSSSAPRAEFNGTDLSVFVQRRPSKHNGSTGPTPIPGTTQPPLSSPESIGSPSSSSISSLTSPSLDGSVQDEEEPPIVTRSTGPLDGSKRSGRTLTGREGAKAAARAARDEAMLRAKEAAKALPKVGRRIQFRKDKDTITPSSSPATSGAPTLAPIDTNAPSSSPPKGLTPHLERNNTVKARPSPSSRSPSPSASSLEPPAIESSSTSPSPSRPKFRNNLTLRPQEPGTTFAKASQEEPSFFDSYPTPKVERKEISFT